MSKLPVYKLFVKPEQDAVVNKTSLVKHPAYMRNFMAFSDSGLTPMSFSIAGKVSLSNSEKAIKFSVDDEKRIITGPMLVPDLPIYRNMDGQEFYVSIDAANIRMAAEVYMKNGFSKNVNTEHSKDVDGVYMVESFIVDSQRGILTPSIFDPQPEGTWIASFKVENDDVWKQVKEKEVMGFSIEGMFEMEKIVDSTQEQLERIIKVLSEITAQ